MRAELAPAAPEYFHTGFGMQGTGGSTSVADSWTQLRTVGAQARTMLVAAAAAQWKAKPEACRAEKGFVLGPGGRKASFGSLAEAAGKLPVPENVALKSPKQFRLIGKPMRRLDSVERIDAKTVFGMDMKRPNLHTALVAHAPVFGAKVVSFDAQKVRDIPGVTHVVQTSHGVAVVAKTFWTAKKGRDALEIKWDLGAGAAISSEGLRAQYAELAKQPGPMARKAADPAALKAAAKTIVAEYEVPFLAHAPMEPLNCTVEFRGDSAEIWCGSQFQTVDQAAAAKAMGLTPEKVKLHTLPAGGGFGRRANPAADYVIEACEIARDVKVPGQGGLDARGRHPRRLLPPDVRAPRRGRPRREGRARRLEPRHRRPVDHHRHVVRALHGQGRHRRHFRRRGERHALRHPQHGRDAALAEVPRARALVALRGALAHRLRDGDHGRRDGRRRGRGSGRLPPQAAGEAPARRRHPRPRRAEGRLGHAPAQGAGRAASRCTSRSAASARRWPRSRSRRAR